jgi:hypothetical protein
MGVVKKKGLSKKDKINMQKETYSQGSVSNYAYMLHKRKMTHYISSCTFDSIQFWEARAFTLQHKKQ